MIKDWHFMTMVNKIEKYINIISVKRDTNQSPTLFTYDCIQAVLLNYSSAKCV